MELNEILLYWFLFVSASAFVGTLTGLLVGAIIKGLYNKIKKWMDN